MNEGCERSQRFKHLSKLLLKQRLIKTTEPKPKQKNGFCCKTPEEGTGKSLVSSVLVGVKKLSRELSSWHINPWNRRGLQATSQAGSFGINLAVFSKVC